MDVLTARLTEMDRMMRDLQFQVRTPFNTGLAEDQENPTDPDI